MARHKQVHWTEDPSQPPLLLPFTSPHSRMDDDDHHRYYKAGDCVKTIYGAGVVTAYDDDDDENANYFYRVRLWRIPGQSVASSTVARLTPPSVRS